uniref:GTP binding protein 2 n=3 Tax=Muroidea TaxID=337687 RepID=E9PVQ4_MOUSE
MDSRVSELFGGCCRPGGGPAMGGNLKARGAGGSSSCGGPKGKKKNGRNRGG